VHQSVKLSPTVRYNSLVFLYIFIIRDFLLHLISSFLPKVLEEMVVSHFIVKNSNLLDHHLAGMVVAEGMSTFCPPLI
jgi:hypothetical protein